MDRALDRPRGVSLMLFKHYLNADIHCPVRIALGFLHA